MKSKLIAFCAFFLIANLCQAQSSQFYEITTSKKGNPTFEQVDGKRVSAFISNYNFCFTGNPYSAKTRLYKAFENDIERAAFFTKYNKTADTVDYSYVNTKCTDEGLSNGECRRDGSLERCSL